MVRSSSGQAGCVFGLLILVAGCGTESSDGAAMAGASGATVSGGASAGGTSSASGGASAGKSSGGASNVGGQTGGSPSGGASSGGTLGKGGASGGTSSGGTSSGSGGADTAGSAGSAGETASGGSSAAGGASEGGAPGGGSAGAGGVRVTGRPIVYVGSMADGSPLRMYELDKETGGLMWLPPAVDAGPGPAYLALAPSLSPSEDFLYVANERDDDSGGLTALHLDGAGVFTRINHQMGSDGGFAHVAVDPSGRYAFGASYNGGSVSVFPIEDDGSLGPELDNVDFGGGAQAHAVGFDLAGGVVYVPTKGNDAVQQLLLGADGTLSPSTPAQVTTEDGAGPRHIAVHPNGDWAVVINELDSTLTPYAIAANGTLEAGESVSSLPEGFAGQNTGAHVEFSPDGRFVYGSNRGHDSIAVFSLDQESGELTLIEHEPTRGDTPRDFEIDPAGDVLIVANQNSETLAVFSIGDDGALSPLGDTVEGPPSPCAVQILYLPIP